LGELRGFDVEDLELERAAGGDDLDDLALLAADDRLADRRLVRELLLGRIRLRGADDPVLERLVRGQVPQLYLRADGDDVLGDVLLLDHARGQQPLLEQRDPVLNQRLFVLRVVVLRVLGDVAELARDADALRHLSTLLGREVLDLVLQLFVPLTSEDDFLDHRLLRKERTAHTAPSRAGMVPTSAPLRKSFAATISSTFLSVDLHSPWWIGPIEVPTRVVLAPMAGVSVQAFRRQGRRFGAGLVCSEMVSCAGLHHGNERTLGYLRIAADEHPLAVQIFGSEPAVMAEAARMVEAAGADIVDINFGCPVRKVTKTGAGATLLEEPERACRIVAAVAEAVGAPVSVKMRRGLEDGSRACLELGPRLVAAGASTLTLHPRSARQMYTGSADHSLTDELVRRVDVPVIACGDITSRARAQAVLGSTGAAAVMVGRGAQGNPWALREILHGGDDEPSRDEVAAELILFIREAVRELGESRAGGFLKKFYGWYLGRGRFPRSLKQELVLLGSTDEVVDRLLAAAPGAAPLVGRLEAEHPAVDDSLLELPVSIYGGG
jgi:tRNA-dihydrouridine synthase B